MFVEVFGPPLDIVQRVPLSLPATGPIPVSVSSPVDAAAAVQQWEPGYLFMSVRQEKVEPSLTGIL